MTFGFWNHLLEVSATSFQTYADYSGKNSLGSFQEEYTPRNLTLDIPE